MTRSVVSAVLVLLALITLSSSVYWADETEHVLVTRFGEPIETVSEPGLRFKLPFITAVHTIDKRILSSDALASEYLTRDKKKIVADPISRFRVIEPQVFFQKLGNDRSARQRVDDVVNSELRRVMATLDFDQIVGAQRDPMLDAVAKGVREQTRRFGIDVLDVQIKRADLPEQVERSVFDRMTAERAKVAAQYRAEGVEASLLITAETDRSAAIVLAEARSQADKLRGEGDATAARTYAQAYGSHLDFYVFTRSLQSYDRSLDGHTTFVLTTGSPYFAPLLDPSAGAGKAP